MRWSLRRGSKRVTAKMLGHTAELLEPHISSTTLVCVRWLLRLAEGMDGVVPAWQRLPPVAVASLEHLAEYDGLDSLPLLVLSYPWEGRSHPDGSGKLLQHLRPLLEAIVKSCDECSPTCTWGVLWDYVRAPPAAVPVPPTHASTCRVHLPRR
jgi:hypothetical protein